MKKKLISTTYLRDVEKYNLRLYFYDDYYCCIKEILETSIPFVTEEKLHLIDNDYYIMEIIPKNENYCVRVFFDSDKNILEYYIDITKENGIDEDTKVPYYYDLYTDITIINGIVKVWDEDELEEALENKIITIDDYKLAYKVKEKLLDEINRNTNKYINMDLVSML